MKQAILGYRCWILDEGKLSSLTEKFVWESSNLEAVCSVEKSTQHIYGDTGEHKAPVAECDCGLYAYGSIDKLLSAIHTYWRFFAYAEDLKFVIGLVAGAGDVRIHADGWRSEKMCILRLSEVPREFVYKDIPLLSDMSHALKGYEPLTEEERESIQSFYGIEVLNYEDFAAVGLPENSVIQEDLGIEFTSRPKGWKEISIFGVLLATICFPIALITLGVTMFLYMFVQSFDAIDILWTPVIAVFLFAVFKLWKASWQLVGKHFQLFQGI